MKGKTSKLPKPVPDRYEAAIRLELASQLIRESELCGYPPSNAQIAEAEQARTEYDAATAALRRRTPRLAARAGRSRPAS